MPYIYNTPQDQQDMLEAIGVSSIEDLELLKTLEKDGVDQVISGKAIYEGKLNLKEIFKF